MPNLRWMIVLAIAMAGLIAFVIRSGIMVRTAEEGGQSVQNYHEQVTSTYNRIKK